MSITTQHSPSTTSRSGLAVSTAAVIEKLWAQDGPPPPGPLPLWEPEHLLTVCGDVVRAHSPKAFGRSRLMVSRGVLSAVVGYMRVLHPSTPWVLVPTAHGCEGQLWWRNEGTPDLVADILRAPGPCEALLDADTEASAGLALADGATHVRVAHLAAPRASRVLSSTEPLQSAGESGQRWVELATTSTISRMAVA